MGIGEFRSHTQTDGSFDFVGWATSRRLDLNQIRNVIAKESHQTLVTSKEVLQYLCKSILAKGNQLDLKSLERLKSAVSVLGKGSDQNPRKLQALFKAADEAIYSVEKKKLFEMTQKIEDHKPVNNDTFCHLLADVAKRLTKTEKEQVAQVLISSKIVKSLFQINTKDKIEVLKALSNEISKQLYG